MASDRQSANAQVLEFSPDIVRLEQGQPRPLPRLVLYMLLAMFAILLVWAAFGKLDIIAVAPGKVVPQSYLQIVQPSAAGIIKKILVSEGEKVEAGQVLATMDASMSDADNRQLRNELGLKSLQLARIDAELAGSPLVKRPDDSGSLFAQVDAQHKARRQAYLDALAAERTVLAKAEQDLGSAVEVETKLKRTIPIYLEQEAAYDQLVKDGFAGKLMHMEKRRDRIEKEQDLRAQAFNIASLRATIEQSGKRIAQISSNYRQQLQNERVEAEAQNHKLQQDWGKQEHRHALLELKAPQGGIVKDLATHTLGSVVAPGTVVMTLVPQGDSLHAEVWVAHLDAGIVEPGQAVKIKLTAYPFQHYGMVEGRVSHISPDASDAVDTKTGGGTAGQDQRAGFKALVALDKPYIEDQGRRHRLSPGMQVSAEINLGARTVLEYLLSPIRRTLHEAGRER